MHWGREGEEGGGWDRENMKFSWEFDADIFVHKLNHKILEILITNSVIVWLNPALNCQWIPVTMFVAQALKFTFFLLRWKTHRNVANTCSVHQVVQQNGMKMRKDCVKAPKISQIKAWAKKWKEEKKNVVKSSTFTASWVLSHYLEKLNGDFCVNGISNHKSANRKPNRTVSDLQT